MNETAMRSGILLIILTLVIGDIAIKLLRHKEPKAINLTADEYSLIDEVDEGLRLRTAITDPENIKKINETISGKYKEKKHVDSIKEKYKDVICIAAPIYKKNDPREIDDYSKNSYPEKRGSEYIIYGEAIYIIDSKTIAIRDADQKDYWVGKKTDRPIDTDLIEGLVGHNK